MKVSKHIDAGTVTYIHVRNWGSTNFQINFNNDQLECHLPEEKMRELHEKLGNTISELEEERAEKEKESEDE